MTPPPLRLVLFDFDGVLARYSRATRLRALAAATGCSATQAGAALFGSGLERAYDSGALDTSAYLARLGDGLGSPIDAATWIDARVAATQADTGAIAMVQTLATRMPIGVLTNNGPLMLHAIPRIVPTLFPALEGRVLCSGVLGVRKPQRAIFDHALTHFGANAHETLFVDDLFVNVRGARAAGLHADTVVDARSMRKVLRRYALA